MRFCEIKIIITACDNSAKLGQVEAGDDFLLNKSLDLTNRRSIWDSSDRIKFNLLEASTLNLNLDPQTIVEVVKFDAAGNASVVGGVEYGSSLQLQLAQGCYSLSLFVEGDRIDYSIFLPVYLTAFASDRKINVVAKTHPGALLSENIVLTCPVNVH